MVSLARFIIDLLCISAVTLGELIYGAEKSEQPLRNLADVEGLAARLTTIGVHANLDQRSRQSDTKAIAYETPG